MLTKLQIAPYLAELRDSTDAALHLLDQVEGAATQWLALEAELDALSRSRAAYDRDQFSDKLSASGRLQTEMFDALEAFLAIWARISLLVFPTKGHDDLADFRKLRGRTLRHLLRLKHAGTLKNRALRDAWMHFDERMDRAVLGGYLGGRQRFTADADPSRLATSILRLIAVKTLEVHFRDQDGAARSSSLPALRTALQDLERCLKQAWRNAEALADGLNDAKKHESQLATPTATAVEPLPETQR